MSTAMLDPLPRSAEQIMLREIQRRIREEFPDFGRLLLINPIKRNMFENMLIGLLHHASEPSVEQSIVKLQKAGYTVTRGTGGEARAPGVHKSSDAGRRLAITHGSHRHRMLAVWWDKGEEGATSEEACRLAGLPMRTCYWARATELQQAGYIETIENDEGEPLQRAGESGTPRKVFRITPLGSDTILSLV